MDTDNGLRAVFLENLDRIRQEKGLSLPELSERIGHHRSYLGKIYRENMGVTLELIEELSEALDTDPSDFLSE